MHITQSTSTKVHMKTYHLLPAETGWKLTLEGFDEVIEQNADHTKEKALEVAIQIIEGSEDPASLKIHNADGSFAEERTYPRSADPRESAG